MYIHALTILSPVVENSTKIKEDEVHLLSLRLQIALEPYDIKLDQDTFESMIRQDNCEMYACLFFILGSTFKLDCLQFHD